MTDKMDEYVEEIDLKHKIGYTSCNTANVILSGLGLGSLDIFYLKFYGLDPRLMAFSWVLFAAWNAVNDPLIGIIEDKTKSSLGRRVPYLRYGAIPYTIAFILVWFPFILASNVGLKFMQNRYPGIDSVDMGLFWNHLIILFVFDTLFSMIGLITFNLPAEMTITAKGRSDVVLFSVLFGVFGMVLPIFLPTILLGGDNRNKNTCLIVMVVIGIISGIMLYWGSYYIKENKYAVHEETLGFLDSIKETFKNKPFLILEITIFSLAIMQEIIFTGIIHLMDYVIIFNGWKSIIAAIPVGGIILFSIFWSNRKISKYGLKKIMLGGACIGIIGFLIILIIGLSSPNNRFSIEAAVVGLAFLAIGLILFLLNQQPMMAEVVDYDETRTGKRRETTYSGVNALITKPALSLAHFLLLTMMARYGYNEDIMVSEQPNSVSLGVLLAFTLIPIVCLTIGIIALYFFPLDGEEWLKKKAELREIHKQKEREFLESLKEKGMELT